MKTRLGTLADKASQAGFRRSLLIVALAGAVSGGSAQAQIYNVSTAEELATAMNAAYTNSQPSGAPVTTINMTSNITGTVQMIVNANVVINGGGFTLDMNNADRAFFIAGGNVTINNLTIANGLAQGGSGKLGGGGGAGLGGAIFVGSGTYFAWDGSVAASGISAPAVTLNGVIFYENSAVGGSSIDQGTASGGGGGMGGNGGQGVSMHGSSGNGGGGGGGGGFGMGANGGDGGLDNTPAGPGSTGSFVNISVTNGAGGPGGTGDQGSGAAGGDQGGGGGGGGPGENYPGSGGGGGLSGQRGFYTNATTPNNGGLGGFGGGGGGNPNYEGGAGGFGGGGGSSASTNDGYSGGNGGFGGGGGAGEMGDGSGGFGAGNGADSSGYGGGGLGAGGAVFVMSGSSLIVNDATFSGNTVTGGSSTSTNSGSAIGANLFLGGNVTFNVSSSLTVSDLGGAGNMSDPNVSAHAADPNAQGGLIKWGEGTLTLSGVNSYSGQTVINSGVLALGAGAQEIGTSGTVVGVGAGDVATLQLTGGSTWQHGAGMGPLVMAQEANSQGNVIIGSGGTSLGAVVGVQTFQGGAGSGTVSFQQMYGASGEAQYVFNTTMTGNIAVVQDGPGTTVLNPLYGSNTYSAGTEILQGTLIAQGVNALGTNEVIVSGSGALVLASNASVTGIAGIQVGSSFEDNATLQLESANTLSVVPGGQVLIANEYPSSGKVIIGSGANSWGSTVSADEFLGGPGNAVVEFQQMYSETGAVVYRFTTPLTGSIQVVQNGLGTTLLAPSASNTYWGGTVVQQGVLQVGGTAEIPGNNALGSGGVTVTGGEFFNASEGALINRVTLAGGKYKISVNSGQTYAGMTDATSGFGNGRATTASVLAGTSSEWNYVSTSFATTSTASNDFLRQSDVYSFSGTGSDIFVLELSMSGVGDGSYLGWLDANGVWINAIAGSTYTGPGTYVAGAYNAATDFALGTYGYDEATGSAWAVVDQEGVFAIVPEPSTWALLVMALGGSVVTVLRRRAGRAGSSKETASVRL